MGASAIILQAGGVSASFIFKNTAYGQHGVLSLKCSVNERKPNLFCKMVFFF